MINFACWPTADIQRSNATAREWARLGWQVAVCVDSVIPEHRITPATVTSHVPPLRVNQWRGYYDAMRALMRSLCLSYRADIVVAGADNILPDPDARAAVVGAAFASRFPNSMGVLQPVGEPWKPTASGDSAQPGLDAPGRRMHATPSTLERCESPVLGRAFILETYGGQGPWHEGYKQYFGDVELFEVAKKMGVLWQNPALRHQRAHWSQSGGPSMKPYQTANYDRWYEADQAMLKARRYKLFEGAEARRSAIVLPGANGLALPRQTGIVKP